MDFNDIKTDELIEIYKKIDEFIKFLEKEKQEAKKHKKPTHILNIFFIFSPISTY